MTRFFVFAIAFVAIISFGSSTVLAQSSRTFVSTSGGDANPCTVAAPCRTIQAAVNAVATGGEVLIRDSGGFGTNIQITKSVSVLAEPGVLARVVSSGSAAITVNGSNIDVLLDGLGITGNGTGISFTQGRTLVVRNADININGGTSIGTSASTSHLSILDSVLRGSNYCVAAQSSVGGNDVARVTVTGVRALDCFIGIYADSNSNVAVSNSTVSGKSATQQACGANYYADNGGILTVESSISTHCYRGLVSEVAGSLLSVANSLIAFNAFAGSVFAPAVGQTSGNNRVLANSNNTLSGFNAVVPLQ